MRSEFTGESVSFFFHLPSKDSCKLITFARLFFDPRIILVVIGIIAFVESLKTRSSARALRLLSSILPFESLEK